MRGSSSTSRILKWLSSGQLFRVGLLPDQAGGSPLLNHQCDKTEVCRTPCLPDPQIKRQHVNRFATPGPIKQLRIPQSSPDIYRHSFENRRLLLRLRTPGVAVSIVTAVHQFFEEAGRLWHDHALDALFSRNLGELFGDFNRLIETTVLVYQSPLFPLAPGPNAALADRIDIGFFF